MRDKLILSGIAIVLVLVSFLVLSTAGHSTTVSTNTDAEEWPSFVAYYHEKGPLSFIAAEGVGEQIFELDYTDATHWTRTILSSTVEGAAQATAILDGNIVTLSRPAINDTYTMTVDALACQALPTASPDKKCAPAAARSPIALIR